MISDLFDTFEKHVLPELTPTETTPTESQEEIFTVEEPKTPQFDEAAIVSKVTQSVLEALKREKEETATDGLHIDNSSDN